jgi:UDP-glucose 4-epimerase
VPDEPDQVLVTGAAGFVGRYVVRELLAHGLTCVTMERSACDLADAGAVRSFCAGRSWQAVVHLAARIPGTGGDELEPMIRDNMVATDNVLGSTPGAAQFVHVSTLDVYGRPTALPMDETSPTEPVTAYGITKLAAEKLVQARRGAAGLPHCILRLSQVYGPGEPPIKLIPRTVERLARGEPPVIFGDGSDLRDWIHVRDVALAVAAAIARRATGIVNVATGRSRSVLDVIRAIAIGSGRPLEPRFLPRPSPRVDFRFDVRRLEAVLGFRAQVDMEAALHELCAPPAAPAAATP